MSDTTLRCACDACIRREADQTEDNFRQALRETLNPKDKIGATKVPYSHIPATGLAHQAMAHGDGTRKYGLYNWREIGVQASEYVSAAMRHIEAWFNGEETAPDSGIHHLGHAAACLNIIMDCQEIGNLKDDRPPSVPMDAVHERLRKDENK